MKLFTKNFKNCQSNMVGIKEHTLIDTEKHKLLLDEVDYVDNVCNIDSAIDNTYEICNKKYLKSIRAIYYYTHNLYNSAFSEFLHKNLTDEDIKDNFNIACALTRKANYKTKLKFNPDDFYLLTFNYLNAEKIKNKL